MAVCKDFYAKAAGATAFTQQPASDAPETFDKPYQGLGASGGNVVDFLEVILTDFSRLESETAASEAEEADEYKTFMFESKKDKALKENEIRLKRCMYVCMYLSTVSPVGMYSMYSIYVCTYVRTYNCMS